MKKVFKSKDILKTWEQIYDDKKRKSLLQVLGSVSFRVIQTFGTLLTVYTKLIKNISRYGAILICIYNIYVFPRLGANRREGIHFPLYKYGYRRKCGSAEVVLKIRDLFIQSRLVPSCFIRCSLMENAEKFVETL